MHRLFFLCPLVCLLVISACGNTPPVTISHKTTPPKNLVPETIPSAQEIEPNLQTGTGTVGGSLSYPGEGIPPDMTVCALNLTTSQTTCTKNHLKGSEYQYGLGYKLELAAGNYLVYASTDVQPNYKAYYNDFATCGLQTKCENHKAKVVSVGSGSVLSQIDPVDWYDPSQ